MQSAHQKTARKLLWPRKSKPVSAVLLYPS